MYDLKDLEAMRAEADVQMGLLGADPKYDILVHDTYLQVYSLGQKVKTGMAYVDTNIKALEMLREPAVMAASGIISVSLGNDYGQLVTTMRVDGTLLVADSRYCQDKLAAGEVEAQFSVPSKVLTGLAKLSDLSTDKLMDLVGQFAPGRPSLSPMIRGYGWAKEYMNKTSSYKYDTQGMLANIIAARLKG